MEYGTRRATYAVKMDVNVLESMTVASFMHVPTGYLYIEHQQGATYDRKELNQHLPDHASSNTSNESVIVCVLRARAPSLVRVEGEADATTNLECPSEDEKYD